jgi:hypothetical protein
MKKKIAHQRLQDLLIGVQGDQQTTNEEFDEVVTAYKEAFQANDYRIRFLLFTDAGIDAKQRKRAAEAGWSRGTSRAVVVTRGTFVRGVVTALGWLGIPVRSAAPPDCLATLRSFLAMSDDEVRRVRVIVDDLRHQVIGETPSADEFLKSREHLEAS